MQEILEGCEGVVILMDDILVFGEDKKEHVERLIIVLKKLENAGVTLNKHKIEIGVKTTEFLGHIVRKDGIAIHPDKIKAIIEMEPPSSKKELQQLLGMVNFLAKAVPDRSTILEPLYSLLKKDSAFIWESAQKIAFGKLKTILTSAPTLAIFDPKKETIITADASSYGIGGALLQRQDNGDLRPIAYISRRLTDAEKRYAQIEKEALAQTWTCEKFEDFIIGIHVKLETDHKPLIPIFTEKPLDSLSPRLQRFCIKLMKYDYSISYVPGKKLTTADTLSRKPLNWTDKEDMELQIHTCGVINSLPVSGQKLQEIVTKQKDDDELAAVRIYIVHGWPEKANLTNNLRTFWEKRHEITLQNDILMNGVRIIIPKDLQPEMLDRIHDGHLGVTKCRARAKEVIWWPGMSTEIANLVQNCNICAEHRSNRHEPLLQHEKADRPWQKAGMDLFKLESSWYLVIIDRYSRYLEVEKLPNFCMNTVIDKLKSIMARHGIIEEIMSDNGTQFNPYRGSKTFEDFRKEYGFELITSSPHYAQSNGLAESAVKIAKAIIKKNKDWHKGLLIYRNSPLENGYSPAELSMNRKLRDNLPVQSDNLAPKIPNKKEVESKEIHRRRRTEDNYNRSKGARELPELTKGDKVYIKDAKCHGEVICQSKEPRSYIVSAGNNHLRRNRHFLIKTTKSEPAFAAPTKPVEPTKESPPVSSTTTTPTQVKTTRSGRKIKPPNRFNFEL